MATLGDFLRMAFRNQHGMLDHAVKELTPEQLHWIPEGSAANHIGFTLWHIVRTEDNIVQFILQDRKPTIWVAGGYHERFGLDKVAQGTAMPTEAAHALRLPPIGEWMEYQRAVAEATDAYLESVDEGTLDAVRKVQPFGEISAAQALSQVCLTHNSAHFGEINMLRVLGGMGSSTI
jgi:hypothetical protein